MPQQLLTIKRICDTLGISRQAFADWKRRGLIAPVEGRRYDLEQARAVMIASSGDGNRTDAQVGGDDPLRSMAAREARAAGRPRQTPADEDVGVVDIQELRSGDLQLMRARARFSRDAMEALKSAGRLVDRKRVGDFLRLYIKEVREHVRSMPDHWVNRFSAELRVNPQKVSALLKEMSAETLETLENANLAERFDRDIQEED